MAIWTVTIERHEHRYAADYPVQGNGTPPPEESAVAGKAGIARYTWAASCLAEDDSSWRWKIAGPSIPFRGLAGSELPLANGGVF